ncbi:TPA: hypothetical protein N0F65_007472 [Lagenidium giganteum]|uniref:AB hydrolase-1 domain-containing protein n=1 Tax=Lagenidium giganteum TaxID=4803 RepID=A0AAV2ZII5_9STRA|nr:TPA: hypothetical protein N0F65_007472 [Lagenidium giganteum]
MLLRRLQSRSLVRPRLRYGRFLSTASAPHIEDEYKDNGDQTVPVQLYQATQPFHLGNGQHLEQPQVCYTTYGQLNAAGDNAIVLCHALTGHSLVHQWWDSMVTPEWTDRYLIVCANVLGSCYGSTGPTSINPATQQQYGHTFPRVSVRDAVRLQKQLLQEELGVKQVKAVIGGSMGGMQTLEWAFFGPEFVRSFIPIACGSHHSAWQIGISELQRQAIAMDPLYKNGQYDPEAPPTQGMSLARQIAMVTYRTHAAYSQKYGRERMETDKAVAKNDDGKSPFLVQSYLEYQGQKFLSRFDVNSYVALTHLMDTHDVGRDRGGIEHALSTLTQPSLVVGVDSDVLYPISEQEELARQLPNSSFKVVSSPHGHDAFLLEQHAISAMAKKFLDERVN